ncbi:hypothetical protein NLU13_4250 [Sarocladium strictum]|uniref:Glycoside hydrolase family 39 n=1 Tax=Sarocladium strictum TaxID=5046 RepID=A0AA39L804_SARSR|nr:hypothetical protein NLU13_4250 [Sarocladium strictum]
MYSAHKMYLALLLGAGGPVLAQDVSPQGTASVDLSIQVGQAAQLGSGFIYGWPDNGVEAATSIPEELVTGMGFHSCRAGGAQLPAPALGWATGGYDNYIGRLESTLSNYRTTRKYGGDFILLPHDLWGADGGLDGPYPGDNGNWTEMEKFWDQVISDLKGNDMLEGLVIDLWNEPDINTFWGRSWDQYLEYYVRANEIVRRELPNTLISGPSNAGAPALNSDPWNRWMERIAADNAIPDIYSWHQIGDEDRQPDKVMPDFNAMRKTYGLPERPIDVNEYAWPESQNPAHTTWYLAQLERHNLRGLRANWGSGGQLHDLMADLVFHDNGTYRPNGEWYLYQYYTQMKGTRVKTTGSEDLSFDAFAVVSDVDAKIITGTRNLKAPYQLVVTGLSALGLPDEGTVQVRTIQFNWSGKATDTGAPVDLGLSQHSISNRKLVMVVEQPTNTTSFAFELTANSSG